MKQINTLIKPTQNCNLRCKYCFHEKYGYSNDLLDIKKLKKYIDLLSSNYDYINLVWHGGEPLLVPLSYYEEIYNYCKEKKVQIKYSIQTNGTLLSQENIDFFRSNNTDIGLSFDGLKNEYTRSATKMILNSIKLLQKNDYYPGAIMVVNQSNVNNLIEEYEYFKSLNLGMKINPMFNDGAACENYNLYLDIDNYIKKFVDLFIYWANDANSNISISTFEELLSLIVNEHSRVCTHNSCLGKWLCLNTDGMIYPCDRLCTSEYKLGDVENISSIEEVFASTNFLRLLEKSVIRRTECIKNCEYYKNCYSGCNANAILNYGNKIIPSYCVHKEILKLLKDYIIKSENRISSMNQIYKKILIKNN